MVPPKDHNTNELCDTCKFSHGEMMRRLGVALETAAGEPYAIVGSSPEIMVRVEGDRLVFDDPGPNGEETAPIANLYARFGSGRPNRFPA